MAGGRPSPMDKIDMEKVELCGKFKATYETMADFFQVSKRTIIRWMEYDEDKPETMSKFCHHYKKGLSEMKLKVSEAQVKTAIEDRNPTMLVWLGKQHLGQSDKKEIDQTIKGVNISFNVDDEPTQETSSSD